MTLLTIYRILWAIGATVWIIFCGMNLVEFVLKKKYTFFEFDDIFVEECQGFIWGTGIALIISSILPLMIAGALLLLADLLLFISRIIASVIVAIAEDYVWAFKNAYKRMKEARK